MIHMETESSVPKQILKKLPIFLLDQVLLKFQTKVQRMIINAQLPKPLLFL